MYLQYVTKVNNENFGKQKKKFEKRVSILVGI
jgi:hypothetical protein